MIKIDSSKKGQDPEDTFSLETDCTEFVNLDLEVALSSEILLRQEDMQRIKEELDRCFSRFLALAREHNIYDENENYPSVDHIVDDDGFLKRSTSKGFSITIDFREDLETIGARLDKFKELVLGVAPKEKEALRDFYGGFYSILFHEGVRDKKGLLKKHRELLEGLDAAIEAYQLIQNASALSVASAMGIAFDSRDEKQCKSAEKQVNRLCNRAEAIMYAVVNGTFYEEIAKPIRDY